MKDKGFVTRLLPLGLLLVGVGVAPLWFVFLLSFKRLNLKTPWLNEPFIGLSNFLEIWNESQFWRAFLHTISFVGGTLVLEVLIGFALAYSLYRAGMTKSYLTQMALFLPLATPAVLSGQMWRLFFHDVDGILNQIMMRLGWIQSGIPWLSDPPLAWCVIGLAEVWKLTPFVTLIFLSGLTRIPKDVWEAAAVDGAGGWARVWQIAIPMIRSSFFVVILFRVLDGIRVFDLIYVLTQGGPGGSTDVLGLYVYRILFGELSFGRGSAVSVVMLGLAMAGALLIVLVFRKGKTQRMEEAL